VLTAEMVACTESFPRTRESLFGAGAVRGVGPVTEIPAFVGMTQWVLGDAGVAAREGWVGDCGRWKAITLAVVVAGLDPATQQGVRSAGSPGRARG
jgi:hypothetical protein